MSRKKVLDEENKNDGETSTIGELCNFAKQLFPFIAVASVGAATIGAVSIYRKKRNEKPQIDDALKDFKHLSIHMGDSAAIQRLVRFTCLSPDWRDHYFGRIDKVIAMYNKFHLLSDNIDYILAKSEEEIRNLRIKVESGDVRTNKDKRILSEHWKSFARDEKFFCYKTLYETAKELEYILMLRHQIVVLGSHLIRLVKAFNIYWSNVEKLFMANIVKIDGDNAKEVFDEKLRVVELLASSGLDSVLKVGRYESSDSLNNQSSSSSHSIDYSSRNEIVTKHIVWWVMLHTAFLPSMKCVADALGWTDDGNVDNQSQFEDEFSEARDENKKTKIRSARKISASSPLTQQFKVWKSRIKTEGIFKTLKNPWQGFQPSPWEDTFIPTSQLDVQGIQNALDDIMIKLDSDIEFMFQCSEYIDDVCKRILVNVGEAESMLQTPLDSDEDGEMLMVANESRQRIEILQNIWSQQKSDGV